MPQYLNQQFGFDEVRWATTRQTAYDSKLSFRGAPKKMLLPVGTVLVRLIAIPNGKYFDQLWWMPKAVFDELRNDANHALHGSGRLLRNYVAQFMSLPSGSFQLGVVEVKLKQPVYAWVGPAAGLFERPGGLEQIYLPNLAESGDPTRSLVASLVRTYWLKF